MTKVWVVTGKSESGDEYGPLVFSKEPTQKTKESICFSWDGDDETKEGPGDYGSFVFLTVSEVLVDVKIN